MEIRALTGFDMETRQQFGRSYSPLSGCNPALGAIGSQVPYVSTKQLTSIPYTIPQMIPPQKIEMLDTSTGKKKWFTVDNIDSLTKLLEQGQKLIRRPSGGSGSKTVYVKTPVKSKTKVGLSKNAMIGIGLGLVAAVALFVVVKKYR